MDPILGSIQLFGFNFAPRGWMTCDGTILAISSNTALFSLLGTTYGGDGQTTFALPDLRGRVPMHQGNGPGLTPRTIGESSGEEAVTLTTAQMPAHGHGVQGSATASSKGPSGLAPAYTEAGSSYGAPDGTAMAPAMVQSTGGSQPHDNMQPYLTMNYCIAVEGIFPSRN